MKEKREVVELVNRVKQNDQEAFQKLYEIYANNVYFTAWDYFHNEHTAKDVVQDVFIRIYNKIDTLESPEAFYPWMKRITMNICHDYERKKKKLLDLGDDVRVEDFEDVNQQTAKEIIENKEMQAIVYNCIHSLNASLRNVALLRYYDELQVSEIAYILQIPEGTVYSRLNHLRSKLKVMLEKQGISAKSLPGFAISPMLIQVAYASAAKNIHAPVINLALQTSAIGVGSAAAGSKVGLGVGAKIALASTIGVSGVVGAIMLNQEEKQPAVAPEIQDVQPVVQELASITDVQYPTNWTNQPITLTVITSNMEYDQILVNNQESLVITSNGSYSVTLMKDGKQIDERIVSISTFDMHSPVVQGYEIDGTTYTIYVSDDASQVNFESIRYYENGVRINKEITIHPSLNQMIVTCPYGITGVLYISDYAGNELEITLHDES
ncbi:MULTISPECIES: sigma-70 family RNA polymerase sigma factor [unclassified Breznakia]|uniref:sigma-70 family RNA polymerase sigma factor n=1 Tax=unclassified Breznakia TaxID=2623764 RepID=UPI002474371C|nr:MULTISPECIES: sigma-70 family RNA polymerase sigma factor [unclassified Breznakia]MDH6365954.1 RNA polymerase sigma factor (sigma-70 family) [Breznakia sp. PH1-1]MDH6403114.1 RNA polymerase sigma factor (sigma-70 family) [Breznakia sp. PF1-11]MDH6410823.1 RNA polymerase sigma factor (sigma-70 family) [Breznakia sp. PFB1-11]MDH6413120.1 RNA polymerase sigma factor (sigma-70 family) [Breznakia sp. PFB1-14]MDH6415488.1 RNA polymerase sigma factor (sigma-70 family) [Breznakia sp. PFB1-4]